MHLLAFIFDGFDVSQFADLLPSSAFATYVYIIGGYHVVLMFAIVFKNKQRGFSMSLGSTLITHLAFLTIVVGLAVAREYIPFFSLIRFFIPGIAPFEANWLFGGGKKQAGSMLGTEPIEGTPAAEAASTANAEDYEEFLKLLYLNQRPHRRPGSSLKEEFERWRAARAKEQGRGRASSPTTSQWLTRSKSASPESQV
jgi:hypothetical protein